MKKRVSYQNMLKKIIKFLKVYNNTVKYIDGDIFANIDKYKEESGLDFYETFLEYIKSLPLISYDNAVKIAREVYQIYGKEKDFDEILESLEKNHAIDNCSYDEKDDNFIIKASEDKILLTGTYYDVITLCHEIGHKLRYQGSTLRNDIMDDLFWETPPIALELAANKHLKEKYDINIDGDDIRRGQVLELEKFNNISTLITKIVFKLAKEKRLNIASLFREFIKHESIVSFLSRENNSIEECIGEEFFKYAYDIGYIYGSFINDSSNKKVLLDKVLSFKTNGIDEPFTIDEDYIKEALSNNQMKRHL